MRRISCQQCTVRDHSCIADLPLDDLGEFQTCGVTGLYKPRQVVFHQGTPAAGLYILCQGTVKLYQSDRFGRDFIIDIATPGAVLGELHLHLAALGLHERGADRPGHERHGLDPERLHDADDVQVPGGFDYIVSHPTKASIVLHRVADIPPGCIDGPSFDLGGRTHRDRADHFPLLSRPVATVRSQVPRPGDRRVRS